MDWFLIAARSLHFAAAISLAGVFAFACCIAGPALRQADAGAAAAARLRRRFGWLAWASLALALISGAAWLVAVAAAMSGKPLAAALSQDLLALVLTRTRFGEDWMVRFVLAVLLAACLVALDGRRARRSGAIGWVAFAIAALMLASLAWAGHGAATAGPAGDLHLAGDIVHLLAAGFWLGTLPPLALLLVHARRIGDAPWAAVARIAAWRFSILGVASVIVLVASGLVNTWFLAGNVPALVGTPYGRLLLAKIGLFLAMAMVGAVNLMRLTPRLVAQPADAAPALWRTIARLQRNAQIETAIGLGVIGIVGALGILPPGLHTEPGWPFPFRLALGALPAGTKILLALLAAAGCVLIVAAAAAAAAGRYRGTVGFVAGIATCAAVGWFPLHPAIERAYPTSYYAPAEPYAAPSVARGATVYAANCAACHGASGRGDGPAAAGLPVRPANLTAPHLFAHSPGDLFWWVSHGRDDGMMPGFAAALTPQDRWDVINFIRARAAGVLTRTVGTHVTTEAAYPIPDFAFETGNGQVTLGQMLHQGPVLLILFAPPVPATRLAQLAAAPARFAAAGRHAIAVSLDVHAAPTADKSARAPFVVGVSADVVAALAPFRAVDDGGETELMLDRNGNVRTRWTRDGRDGLAPPDALIAAAKRVARFAVAAPSHAGHGQ